MYRVDGVDVPQERERNYATAKYVAWPSSAWLLLSFFLFPVRHPLNPLCTENLKCLWRIDFQKSYPIFPFQISARLSRRLVPLVVPLRRAGPPEDVCHYLLLQRSLVRSLKFMKLIWILCHYRAPRIIWYLLNMTVFGHQKGSSYTEIHWLIGHSVNMTLLPIPKGVILTGELYIPNLSFK